jgi:HK97 family phage major capsid protein
MPAQRKLKSGDKLPIQHREYKIDKSKIDAEKRTVEILFSTDDPAERWFGNEILDHSPGACDLRRLNDGGAFLKDHNDTQQIGVHESASISVVAIGSKQRGEGRAVVRFAPSTNALAEQEFLDMQAGVRTKISTGYIPREMKLIEEDDDGNETWLVTKWEVLENSLVAIPLDPNCAAGRARKGEEEFPVVLDRSFRKPENNDEDSQKRLDVEREESQKRENQPTNMETPEEKAAREAKEAKQRQRDEEESARERAAQVQEGIKLAREREKEIRAIASKANDKLPKEATEKAIEDATSDERAVENFRKLVFEKYFGAPEPINTPAGEGNADIKIVGERGDGKRKLTAGERFVSAKGFKEFVDGNKKGEFRANVGGSILAEKGLVTRAGFNSTDLGAVNVTISQEMISLGVQRLTIMDLLAGGVMTTAGFIYPVENSFDPFADAAQTVAERGLKPEWEPDITTARADAQVLAVMATVPKQFMADFGAFGSWLNSRGDYLLQIKAEQQILYGDGLGSNLLGITARPGIQARAYGTVVSETTADALFRGNTDIETNAYFDVDGFAMHPYDFEQIRLLKDANGQYLGGGPFYAPYGTGTFVKYHTIWGLPCVVSKSVKQGKPIAGAWKMGAQWFLREGLQIETSTSHKDYFQRNLLAVLFEERMALAVYRPIAFLEHTGFPGRS